MKINWRRSIFIAVVILIVFVGYKMIKSHNAKKASIEEIIVERGDIKTFITTTGTVLPQNRLEIKPPITGRIEEILVQEGQKVKKGEVVAWMSSTERAALLDAARSKGEESMQYWQEAYKATPLISPLDGDVIVRSLEPGQTVTSADPVVVLSDRLIVKAQVDETDIGRVKVGQEAIVSLDAYPKDKIKSTVDHISYESTMVNNVTIYEVDILTESVPETFRSGMTANVEIIEDTREDVLILPLEAVERGKDTTVVGIRTRGLRPERREVKLGLSDDRNVEVLSGVSEGDTVIIEKVKSSLPKKSSTGSNPFMPNRGGGRGR